MVKSSREALLEYCKTFSGNDFLTESKDFGRGSIRNLLVHIGNIYGFWIGKHAFNKNNKSTEYSAVDFTTSSNSFIKKAFRIFAGWYRYNKMKSGYNMTVIL